MRVRIYLDFSYKRRHKLVLTRTFLYNVEPNSVLNLQKKKHSPISSEKKQIRIEEADDVSLQTSLIILLNFFRYFCYFKYKLTLILLFYLLVFAVSPRLTQSLSYFKDKIVLRYVEVSQKTRLQFFL